MTGIRKARLLPAFGALVLLACSCATSPPQADRREDRDIAAAMKQGRRAFSLGQHAAASRAFADALNRARALDDPAGIGDSAYNLASCCMAMGQYVDACPYLLEARVEFARLGNRKGLAQAWLLEARTARVRGNADAAEQCLDRALRALPRRERQGELTAQIHLLRAQLACDAARPAHMQSALKNAAEAGADDEAASSAVRAQTATLRGQLNALNGKPHDAAGQFDNAAAAYRDAGQPANVVRALVAAADHYESAGSRNSAAERRYRAARSYYAQGEVQAAAEQLASTIAIARRDMNEELLTRARALLGAIEASIQEALKDIQQKEEEKE